MRDQLPAFDRHPDPIARKGSNDCCGIADHVDSVLHEISFSEEDVSRTVRRKRRQRRKKVDLKQCTELPVLLQKNPQRLLRMKSVFRTIRQETHRRLILIHPIDPAIHAISCKELNSAVRSEEHTSE